jgi:serine/threonine protein kinase
MPVAKVPCLRLAGIVGIPSSKAVLVHSNILPSIYNKVRAALDHAHGRKWIHLDVQPSNIVVKPMNFPSGDPEVMVIDWACGARTDVNLSGFRGCIPYAHKDLLDMGYLKWNPKAEYDHHSLAYSIATLANKGKVPWDGFNTTRHGEELVSLDKQRVKLTISLLCQNELAGIKDAAIDLLRPQSNSTARATRGSTTEKDAFNEIVKEVEAAEIQAAKKATVQKKLRPKRKRRL